MIPDNPAGSPVYRRVESGDMPRSGARLNPAELATLKAWIECGAPAIDEAPPVQDAGAPDARREDDVDDVDDDDDDDDDDDEVEEADDDRDDEDDERGGRTAWEPSWSAASGRAS